MDTLSSIITSSFSNAELYGYTLSSIIYSRMTFVYLQTMDYESTPCRSVDNIESQKE